MSGAGDNPITDLPPGEFIAICGGWKADMELTGEWDAIQADFDADVLRCPVHQYATLHGICQRVCGGTTKCPICGNYMCPDCQAHSVDVMSRVTGYMQVISGWNVAKKQEFEDRKRYSLG